MKDQSNTHVLLRMHGQSDSSLLYGRHPLSRANATGLPSIEVMLAQGYNEYLPGQENCVADEESQQTQTSAEWKLHHDVQDGSTGTDKYTSFKSVEHIQFSFCTSSFTADILSILK